MRIAVIGCGGFGKNHLRVAAESGAELAFAVDIDLDRARAAGLLQVRGLGRLARDHQ
ncbi:MAG: hypothetical protein R2762_20425 [Bryobacteraceae bacterium]